MKQTKQRVIALDYFRGLCIIVVLLDHSSIFSRPLPLLVGSGSLWTSAAEMFFLLSGLTFGIVRNRLVDTDFKAVILKSWRRAGFLFLLNTAIVGLSILLDLIITQHHLTNDFLAAPPTAAGFNLLGQIMTFKYSLGWANFLMFYSIYLLVAPFVLYILKSRFWATVPAVSAALYILNTNYPFHLLQGHFIYGPFLTWQLYFVIGMVLARFRVPIIGWFYRLPAKKITAVTRTILFTAGSLLMLNYLLEFNIFPKVNHLALSGWLPIKLSAGYAHLLNQKVWIDNLLMDSRTGLLRPLVTLLYLAAIYLVYQRYNQKILQYTGRFVNGMGTETLCIFVAQALVIPLLAALPFNNGSLAHNLLLSSILIGSMWMISQRRLIIQRARDYSLELAQSFSEAKYAAMYGQLDE